MLDAVAARQPLLYVIHLPQLFNRRSCLSATLVESAAVSANQSPASAQ